MSSWGHRGVTADLHKKRAENIMTHQSDKNRNKIIIATMVKNEDDIIREWIEYHGSIFGFENSNILQLEFLNCLNNSYIAKFLLDLANVLQSEPVLLKYIPLYDPTIFQIFVRPFKLGKKSTNY